MGGSNGASSSRVKENDHLGVLKCVESSQGSWSLRQALPSDSVKKQFTLLCLTGISVQPKAQVVQPEEDVLKRQDSRDQITHVFPKEDLKR